MSALVEGDYQVFSIAESLDDGFTFRTIGYESTLLKAAATERRLMKARPASVFRVLELRVTTEWRFP